MRAFSLWTMAFAGVLTVLPHHAGAQDRRAHWGVSAGFAPRWTASAAWVERLYGGHDRLGRRRPAGRPRAGKRPRRRLGGRVRQARAGRTAASTTRGRRTVPAAMSPTASPRRASRCTGSPRSAAPSPTACRSAWRSAPGWRARRGWSTRAARHASWPLDSPRPEHWALASASRIARAERAAVTPGAPGSWCASFVSYGRSPSVRAGSLRQADTGRAGARRRLRPVFGLRLRPEAHVGEVAD